MKNNRKTKENLAAADLATKVATADAAAAAADEQKVLKAGLRPTSEILVYVDVEAAVWGGADYFVSSNEVILTTKIDSRFFTKVWDVGKWKEWKP